MKLQGGYLPKIPGRPSAAIQDAAVPDRLEFPLSQGGQVYTVAVADRATVAFGAPLAWAETGGGRLASAIQGDARFQLETLPVRYPAEHPRALARALRKQDRTLTPADAIWTLDAQAVLAIGACLAEGIPLHERVVAIGGPCVANPCHRRVRIGTTLGSLLPPAVFADSTLLLRGGLFTGTPAASDGAVETQDDGFFALPKSREREFLGFVASGFDRVSALPCFGSALTGAADRHLTATLRGERRPCVACGLCEKVCPVGLLPQILHRYLYRDAID